MNFLTLLALCVTKELKLTDTWVLNSITEPPQECLSFLWRIAGNFLQSTALLGIPAINRSETLKKKIPGLTEDDNKTIS